MKVTTKERARRARIITATTTATATATETATATTTTTTTTTAIATDNLFNALALVGDSEIDSVYSTPYLPETDSDFSEANHEEYQARVLEDCLLLEDQLGYHRQEDSNDDWDDEEDTMPLNEYDTVQIQKVQRSIINHGYGFILETQGYFQLRTGEPKAILPEAPKRPDKALAVTNYKKFHSELKLYTTYMETERATVELLKEFFP